MKQELVKKILETNLSESLKNRIIDSLTERYVVKTDKSEIKLGDSKIGGFPHLPFDFEYPQEEHYYYEFVGQINLSDLVDNNIPYFPQSGMMYFFIDNDYYVNNVPAKIIVLNPDISKLELKRPPVNKKSRCEAFLDKTEFSQLKLKFDKNYTIDQVILNQIVNDQTIFDKTLTGSFDIKQFYTVDQICGYPPNWGIYDAHWRAYLEKKRFGRLYWLTGDYRIKQLKKENIELREWLKSKLDEEIDTKKKLILKNNQSEPSSLYSDKGLLDLEFTKLNLDSFIDKFAFHKAESKKWRMLFSLSSNYDAEITFGDGKMEFFINDDDFKVQNFNNIYCQIY